MFTTFRSYLETWRRIAEADAVFAWAARAAPADVNRLIEAWASIDRIPDERLRALGCEWSSGAAREFFNVLTGAVMEALHRHQETAMLAERLQAQWSAGGTE